MGVLELIRLAGESLAASRLRSALTMLGVVIGVASVVALAAVTGGAAASVRAQLDRLGPNLVTVDSRAAAGAPRAAPGVRQVLTLDDAQAVRGVDGVTAVEPEIAVQAQVAYGRRVVTTSVVGTTRDYASVRAFTVAQGAFFNETADAAGLRVVVLGAATAESLSVDGASLGRTVTIGRIPFQLAGILDAKGSLGAASSDDVVLIPLTTLRHYLDDRQQLRSVGVTVQAADRIGDVKSGIAELLGQRHGLKRGAVADFTVSDQAQLLGTVGSVSSLLTVLLAGIAAISLLVGAIGTTNIMLVAVRERTREVGLRRAVGARRRDILVQFLAEALALSVLGGLIGLVIGALVGAAIAQVAGWDLVFDPLLVGVAIVSSVLVGTAAGAWPAREAASIDPIEALRYA